MIRQLLASLVVICVAGLAWLFLVPSAPDTLARIGIALPFGPATTTEAATPGATRAGPGGPGGAGPGGRPGGFGARATNVVTSEVLDSTINSGLAAIGEGTAASSATIVASAGGELAEVLVRPGQQVSSGDVIARFSAEAEEIERDRALLAAQDARATLARTEGLASTNLVATTALTAAQLAAANAELALRNSELTLERRSIVSPIAGTAGLIRVAPGNYIAPQTEITTIDDTSSILINFWVPERYAGQLTPGMSVTVSAPSLPGRTFTGDISAIDNRIDTASRTLQVQAEIPNPDNAMRAGMSFSVALDFPGESYPTVNPLAILWSAEGSYVWKLADGKATKVMAEIVQRNSDGVLVRADLEPGDAIITEGILQLSEGVDVTVLDGPGAEARPAQGEAARQGGGPQPGQARTRE